MTANKLHHVHSDLAGPFPLSIHGCKYFVVFFDEFSKKLWVYFLVRKSEMFTKFREWKAMVELQSGHTLREFQSDNGGEYIGHDFRDYLVSKGILHRTSTAYTPQQNGKAERSIRTILERALSMLVRFHESYYYNKVYMGKIIPGKQTIGIMWAQPSIMG